MRYLAYGVMGIWLAGPVLACSTSMLLWEPTSDDDPRYYRVWGGAKEYWIDRAGKPVSFAPTRRVAAGAQREPPFAGMCGSPLILPASAVPKLLSPLDRALGRDLPAVPACQYSFINERGEAVGNATFEETGSFHDGMVAVRIGSLWGYADRTLKVTISPKYRVAREFSEGLAAVYDGKAYSYIDRAGTVQISGPFDTAGAFHDGLAAVVQDGRAYYIDRSGAHAVPGTFAHAGRFFHGLANVHLGGGRLAYIDRTGRVVHEWKAR